MKKNTFLLLASAVFVSAALWIASCQKDTNGTTNSASVVEDRTNGNSKLYPSTAHPFGKSYAEWSADWWDKMMVFNCDDNPWLNSNNVLFYQSGPVYFMAGLNTEGASVDLTVPHGKAILFPLVNFINDYPCPDPTFEPAPGQSLEDFLSEGAAGLENIVSALSLTVDGDDVTNLANYFFISPMFEFTGDPSLSGCFDGCVTGTPQNAVSGGYFIMLKPLSIGTHTIHYHAEIPLFNNWTQDGTYNITVN